MAFVLDASMTMAWCFRDERTKESEAVGIALSRRERAVVPAVWSVEVCNATLRGLRRNRVTAAEVFSFFRALDRFPIAQSAPLERAELLHLLDRARTHELSAYDSSYLDLALHMGLPLATLDARLRQAAGQAGVPLFSGVEGDDVSNS